MDPYTRGLNALIRELGHNGAAAWIAETNQRFLRATAQDRLQRGAQAALQKPQDARAWVQVVADGIAGLGAILGQTSGPSLESVVGPEPVDAEVIDAEFIDT